MGEVYLYAPDADDLDNMGVCGALIATSCEHEEVAGGLSELTLMHPIDEVGRHRLLVPGALLKAQVPVRSVPALDGTRFETTVETWVVSPLATKADRTLFNKASGKNRKAVKVLAGDQEIQITKRGDEGVVVDSTDGLYPDEANLELGDTLYFKGNSAHAEGVGHVEIYIGDGQCAGHGSGTGPKVHNLRSYCQSRGKAKRYYKAVRWIPDDIVPANPAKELPEPTNGIRITGGTVNLRKGPGTQYAIQMVATKGQVYEAADIAGWQPVCVDGAVLWVSEVYSEKVTT